MRLQYPTNIRIIRTPCTGKLEVEYFMRAFENGADGVLVAGCEEGSCHFIEGNLMAKRRVNYTRDILAEAGFEKERLRMVNIGAADARRFVEINESGSYNYDWSHPVLRPGWMRFHWVSCQPWSRSCACWRVRCP